MIKIKKKEVKKASMIIWVNVDNGPNSNCSENFHRVNIKEVIVVLSGLDFRVGCIDRIMWIVPMGF